DDIPVASWPAYNLTTIRQPIDAMVNAVVDLISRPEGDTPSGEMVLLPGELIVRGSARVPAGA
nr:LacI family transcriptional regulator [Anaerolineae bacterium]